MPNQVDEMTDRLQHALTGPAGELVEVERIEFERIAEHQVRWTLFAGGRMIYTATDRPGNLLGWLTCTNVLMGEQTI
jgi:hypothetical protein